MRALPLDVEAAPPTCPGAARSPSRRVHRVRVRVRFKDDGSMLVAGIAACGCPYVEGWHLATPRGVLALWLLPIAGSA